MTDVVTTHAEGCWAWGQKHHACAVREIERLRARVAELERDARLGAVVRDVAATGGVGRGSDAPDQLDGYAQSLADDRSMFGAAVIRAIADALRAEEGGE